LSKTEKEKFKEFVIVDLKTGYKYDICNSMTLKQIIEIGKVIKVDKDGKEI
jgi:hypothetical protein